MGRSMSSGGGRLKSQIFLASGVWMRPANVTAIRVWYLAGGGGGGNGPATTYGGSGGGGGEVREEWMPVSGNVTVTIGAGGLGALANVLGPGADGGITALSDGVNQIYSVPGLGGLRGAGTQPLGGVGGGIGNLAINSDGKLGFNSVGGGSGGSGLTTGADFGGNCPGQGYGGGQAQPPIGYGGGGGARGTNVQGVDATANSGGGGQGVKSASFRAGNGGSGKAIIFWWE